MKNTMKSLGIDDKQQKRLISRLRGYFKQDNSNKNTLSFINKVLEEALNLSSNNLKSQLLKKHPHPAIAKYFDEIEEYISLGYGSQKIKTLLSKKAIQVSRSTLENFVKEYKQWQI